MTCSRAVRVACWRSSLSVHGQEEIRYYKRSVSDIEDKGQFPLTQLSGDATIANLISSLAPTSEKGIYCGLQMMQKYHGNGMWTKQLSIEL